MPRTITDGSNNDVSSNSSHIANINPIRYRGYYYDIDTGFYYLQSRYYDPVVGRFVNADGQLNDGLLGNTLFAYCLNSPVAYKDADGKMAEEAEVFIGAATAGGVLAVNPAGWIVLGTLAIAALAIWAIPWDSIGQSTTIEWNNIESNIISASLSSSISRDVSKAKAKIRKEQSRYDYWIAMYVSYGNYRGTFIPTTPLSYSRAISYVRSGGDVFASSRRKAYQLALAAGDGRTPIGPEIHHDKDGSTLGYWWHYHDDRASKYPILKRGHVFYV